MAVKGRSNVPVANKKDFNISSDKKKAISSAPFIK